MRSGVAPDIFHKCPSSFVASADNKHANQGSQYNSVPTYTLVVHNIALCWLGGTEDNFACSLSTFRWCTMQCRQSRWAFSHRIWNENAWAFMYLPRFPNCTVLLSCLPKSPFFVMDWKAHTNSLCGMIGHNDFTWEIKVIGQTVRPWECWHTDTHTDGKTALILLPRPLTREVIKHLMPDCYGKYILTIFITICDVKNRSNKCMSWCNSNDIAQQNLYTLF